MAGNWQSLLMERLGEGGKQPSGSVVETKDQVKANPVADIKAVDNSALNGLESDQSPSALPETAETAEFIPAPQQSQLETNPLLPKGDPVPEDTGEVQTAKTIDSGGGHEPEDTVPGILDKEKHMSKPASAKTLPWWGKRVEPSPKNGTWVPSTVEARRKRKLALIDPPKPREYAIIDDGPHRLEDPAPDNPEQKSETVKAGDEKEPELKLVERVWFDETGKQIDIHEYVGVAKEFTNFARNLINKFKGKDYHQENSAQAAESMQHAHIVWDNNEKQKILAAQLITARKGSPMESSEQDPNGLMKIDEDVNAEIGADTSLAGVGDPKPLSPQEPIGQIEVTDVVESPQGEHGPTFQERTSGDEPNPLAPDPALEALQNAIASPHDESIDVAAANQTAQVTAPELEGSRVVAEQPATIAEESVSREPLTAPQPEAEHFAAQVARPELRLLDEHSEDVPAQPDLVQTPPVVAENQDGAPVADAEVAQPVVAAMPPNPEATVTAQPPKPTFLQKMFGMTPKVQQHMELDKTGADISAEDVAALESEQRKAA